MANALSQLYQVIIGDQEVRQSIGVDQVLDVINQMGQMMGLPKDFKLQKISDSGSPEQQEQMVQIAEQIKASIMEEVGGAIQPLSENTQQNTQAISQILDALQPPQPPQEEQYDSSVEVPGGGQQVNPTPELVEAR